ncbi:hypothetical protein DPMN_007564 [Dreissena polymorpha]|uniref:Uncharacterized protein n=1 Tax=Dreissena polymorpha TaxID=45954 RepID=A0A9D4RWJ1_DREPO|nr:hypothetical protein DPMN_007564 [Dreissena polymorpha]
MPSNTSWPRTLGQMLNVSYLHGEASLNLGLKTFLLWGEITSSIRDTFLGCAKVLLSVHRGLILTSSGPENGVPQLQHNQYVSIEDTLPENLAGCDCAICDPSVK